MISFALTERDREILAEAREQARLAVKYARDFEFDEDEMLPHEYPEARGRPDVRALMDAHVDELSGRKIIHALLYLEDWYGGIPLRESRYSLGNTVLTIAGRPEQYARWANKTIAIGLTEPIGGSDPASTRTTATYDPGLHHLRSELRRGAGAGAHDPPRQAARALHLHDREGNARIFRRQADSQDGHPFRGYRRALVFTLPHPRAQPYRRRPQEDSAILQRVAPRGRGLRARGLARGDGFYLGSPGGNRRDARLRRWPDWDDRRSRSHARARGRMGGDLVDGRPRQMGRAERRTGQDRFLRRQGDGRRSRAQGDADLHRDPRRLRAFSRASSGEVVPRRPHIRHLRRYRRNPAVDHRTGIVGVFAEGVELG